MWTTIIKVILFVTGLYTASQVGPQAVDLYFLPTIEYVAGTFHAVAPQPAPATAFMHVHAPMPAGPTLAVLKTVFVEQAGYETMSRPETATITGMNDGRWQSNAYPNGSRPSSQDHDGDSSSHGHSHFYRFASFFEWCGNNTRVANHPVLLWLRQVLDSFLFHTIGVAALIVSWKLLDYRNHVTIKNITAFHKQKVAGIKEEMSAQAVTKDEAITSLNAQIKSQRDQLDKQETEAQRAKEAKELVEKQSETEIAELKSQLTEKDNTMIKRDRVLAEATDRAVKAEKSNQNLENAGKKNRSDFESALQKKENHIDTQKRACEKAIADGDTARRELKEARAETSKDRKKINGLEKQVADSQKKTEELEAQVKAKDASLAAAKKASESETRKAKTASDAALVAKADHITAQKSIADLEAKIGILSAQANEEKISAVAIGDREGQITALTNEVARLRSDIGQKDIDIENEGTANSTLRNELAAVRIQLDKERLATRDALSQMNEAKGRIEVYLGDIADLTDQNNELRATLDNEGKENAVKDGDGPEDTKHCDQEDAADTASLGTRRGPGKPQYNRTNKLRSNKRLDGSIYTSKHPRSTPSARKGVAEKRFADEQGSLDGQGDTALNEPVTQGPTSIPVQQEESQHEPKLASSKRKQRVCPYFAQGACRFGEGCFDRHDIPTSSDKPTELPEEPVDQDSAETQSSTSGLERPICGFFTRGNCRFGSRCRHRHDLS